MRGEDDPRPTAAQRVANLIGLRLDEQRVIVELAQLVDVRRAVYLGARPLDILQILAATRVGTKDGGDESERIAHAVGPHLTQRVGEQRMPIAIAPIDGQLQAVARQFAFRARRSRRGCDR